MIIHLSNDKWWKISPSPVSARFHHRNTDNVKSQLRCDSIAIEAFDNGWSVVKLYTSSYRRMLMFKLMVMLFIWGRRSSPAQSSLRWSHPDWAKLVNITPQFIPNKKYTAVADLKTWRRDRPNMLITGSLRLCCHIIQLKTDGAARFKRVSADKK